MSDDGGIKNPHVRHGGYVHKHVDNVDNLVSEKLFSYIYNVSAPIVINRSPCVQFSSKKFSNFIKSREIFAGSSKFCDFLFQIF